jgi:hypothetical protein
MYAYLYMYIYIHIYVIYIYRLYITMQIHPDVIEIFELETACVKSGHVWTLAGHLRFLKRGITRTWWLAIGTILDRTLGQRMARRHAASLQKSEPQTEMGLDWRRHETSMTHGYQPTLPWSPSCNCAELAEVAILWLGCFLYHWLAALDSAWQCQAWHLKVS